MGKLESNSAYKSAILYGYEEGGALPGAGKLIARN